MSTEADRAADELNGKLAGAGAVTNFVLGTAERLSAATVGTVMGVMGGSAGLLATFTLGVAAPAFAAGIVLVGGTLFGASTGALLSRYIGPVARRREIEHHRELRELQRAHARLIIETWRELPADRPERLVDAMAEQIEQAIAIPDYGAKPKLLPFNQRS